MKKISSLNSVSQGGFFFETPLLNVVTECLLILHIFFKSSVTVLIVLQQNTRFGTVGLDVSLMVHECLVPGWPASCYSGRATQPLFRGWADGWGWVLRGPVEHGVVLVGRLIRGRVDATIGNLAVNVLSRWHREMAAIVDSVRNVDAWMYKKFLIRITFQSSLQLVSICNPLVKSASRSARSFRS